MKRAAFASILLAASIHASLAAPINMEPGLWTTRMQMQMNGVSVPSGDRTQTRCVTAQDMQNASQLIPQIARNGCTIQSARRSGDTWSWTINCERGALREHGMGQVTYLSTTRYTGILHTVVDLPAGQTEQIKMNYDSSRSGACPP